MQTFVLLLQWWNLIFVVPFGIGVTLVLMSLSGVGRHGRGAHRGGHHHADGMRGGSRVTHSHHTHHARASVRTQGHKTNAKAQRRGTGTGSEQQSLLRTLHLQNMPSQMLLQNFLLFWGVVGWTCNQIASKSALSPAQFVVASVLAALTGGFFCTLLISITMARFMPEDESFAIHKADLEGRVGEAISAINDRSGSVRTRDDNGTLHQLAARVRAEDENIARGEQVLVVSYFADDDYFQVKKWSP